MEAIEVRATIIDNVPKVGRHSKQFMVCWDTFYRGRHGISSLTFNNRDMAERAAASWGKFHRTYVQEVGSELAV